MAKSSRHPPRRETRPTSDGAAIRDSVKELLEATPDEIVSRLAAVDVDRPGAAAAALQALGATRSATAGRALARIAVDAPDKELRKAARREIHRLRASGVAVEVADTVTAAATVSVGRAAEVRPSDAHTTAPDGTGSRVIWLVLERQLGGLAVFGLVLNDLTGMKDCTFHDMTRKRFRETLRTWIEDVDFTPIELPTDYGLSLISEALALNAELGVVVPTEFQIHRGLLGKLPPPPHDALIHQHVSRGQALLLPNLIDEASQLLEEPELGGWFFDYDESLPRVEELRRLRESRIILSGEPREQREERVIDTAINDWFTPQVRRAIRRRLEEVAYVFWSTGRERSARRAVAAAFAIGEGSLTRHPFVRALVTKSIEIARQVNQAGIDPARLRRAGSQPTT